ncbi:DNA-processing protein DprA, partial [Actinomyces faecalis]|uniref:DNA-processing protein DprA n=1 Tax=Actinomyces faecalis TaxID=2722820 RepID=UPI001552D1A3
RDIDTWANAGYGIVSVLSDRYPTRVREVHEAPALLYYQGALLPDDDGVCVVGSRQAGPASLQAASDVARLLVDRGLTVIAGLAAGIDTAAHQGALDAGGRTVAVMGTGLDHTYPADNTALRASIAASGGLVLTQFEPGAKTTRASFPMRNAVMSGYGLTTFVVAAGEHSGTRTQARYAVRHGRGVIVSRAVARSTSWGQEYAHSGDAAVADTPDDVLKHVEQIRQQRERATQWADQLLA